MSWKPLQGDNCVSWCLPTSLALWLLILSEQWFSKCVQQTSASASSGSLWDIQMIEPISTPAGPITWGEASTLYPNKPSGSMLAHVKCGGHRMPGHSQSALSSLSTSSSSLPINDHNLQDLPNTHNMWSKAVHSVVFRLEENWNNRTKGPTPKSQQRGGKRGVRMTKANQKWGQGSLLWLSRPWEWLTFCLLSGACLTVAKWHLEIDCLPIRFFPQDHGLPFPYFFSLRIWLPFSYNL